MEDGNINATNVILDIDLNTARNVDRRFSFEAMQVSEVTKMPVADVASPGLLHNVLAQTGRSTLTVVEARIPHCGQTAHRVPIQQ